MLFAKGNILQVLEGEDCAVHETFRRNERDVRHYDVFTLIDEDIDERQFDGWSMGYRTLSEVDLKELPDAAQIFQCKPSELATRVRPGAALVVLRSFADGSMGIR